MGDANPMLMARLAFTVIAWIFCVAGSATSNGLYEFDLPHGGNSGGAPTPTGQATNAPTTSAPMKMATMSPTKVGATKSPAKATMSPAKATNSPTKTGGTATNSPTKTGGTGTNSPTKTGATMAPTKTGATTTMPPTKTGATTTMPPTKTGQTMSPTKTGQTMSPTKTGAGGRSAEALEVTVPSELADPHAADPHVRTTHGRRAMVLDHTAGQGIFKACVGDTCNTDQIHDCPLHGAIRAFAVLSDLILPVAIVISLGPVVPAIGEKIPPTANFIYIPLILFTFLTWTMCAGIYNNGCGDGGAPADAPGASVGNALFLFLTAMLMLIGCFVCGMKGGDGAAKSAPNDEPLY